MSVVSSIRPARRLNPNYQTHLPKAGDSGPGRVIAPFGRTCRARSASLGVVGGEQTVPEMYPERVATGRSGVEARPSVSRACLAGHVVRR